jgi:hypothetical protein
MTMRCATSHAVVQGLKFGLSLDAAVERAAEDLLALKGGFIGEVVIHALDNKNKHRVVTLEGQQTGLLLVLGTRHARARAAAIGTALITGETPCIGF